MKIIFTWLIFISLSIQCLAQQHSNVSLTSEKIDGAKNRLKNKVFNQFVDVFNRHDSLALRDFFGRLIKDNQLIDLNVKQTMQENEFAGKLRFIQSKTLSSNETELTLKNEKFHSWFNILWVTDAAGGYKEHHIRPVKLKTEFLQTGSLTRKQVLDSVEIYIDKLTQEKLFAGNVLIAKDHKTLFLKSFGKNTDGKPDSLGQQFNLASIGKMFTTISILQLIEMNKASLDDSVGKLMPELNNKALFQITIRQLLLHTSGMGDYFQTPDYDPMAGKTFKVSDHVEAVENDKLQFAPGTQFSYSNTGFLLLGLIVEKLTSTPFPEYVKNHICKPSGMLNTQPDNGSGGGLSTITDMYRFAESIRSNKLLHPASNVMFMDFHKDDWGFGQEYQQLGNETITGHSGGFINACTELNMYHKSGYTVIVLSNMDPPYGHFIADRIKELLIRRL